MIQSWAALSSSFPESPEPFTTEATEEHREANPKSLNTEEWREQRTEEAFSRELTRTNANNAGVTNDKSFVFGVGRGGVGNRRNAVIGSKSNTFETQSKRRKRRK